MPQDLAQDGVEALAAVLRVAAAAAVAQPDVEHAVGPEPDPAAVVVRVGLGSVEEDGRWAASTVSARDRRGARRRWSCREVGVVDEKAVSRPAPYPGGNARPRRPRSPPAVTRSARSRYGVGRSVPPLNDADAARLLRDEQAAGAVTGARDPERGIEPEAAVSIATGRPRAWGGRTRRGWTARRRWEVRRGHGDVAEG